MNRHGLLLLTALALPGCYTTTITRETPAAPTTVQYDEKWHHGLVWGIAELSGPYDLRAICPNGWAEIKTETSFINGFVEALTSGIYSPQTVSVRCAAQAPPVAPARPASSAQPAPSPGSVGKPQPSPSAEP